MVSRDTFLFPLTIILAEEGIEDLILGETEGTKREPLSTQELSCPDKKGMNDEGIVLAMESDHILIHEVL